MNSNGYEVSNDPSVQKGCSEKVHSATLSGDGHDFSPTGGCHAYVNVMREPY